MAAGLYVDGNKFYTAFDFVRICQTGGELRNMVATLYLQWADPQRIIERHEEELCADIVGTDMVGTEARRLEMLRRMKHASDMHGGTLLRDHPYFAEAAQAQEASTEVERAEDVVQAAMNDPTNREELQRRYESLKPQQNRALDEILAAFREQATQDRNNTDGRVFCLQAHAGTGKTYLLSLLRDMVQAEGQFVEICATTGIAASLYKNGRTLHSFLGLGVEDADATDRHAKLSRYGLHTQRGILIRSLGLLIIDESSMLERILFEHVETILNDLRCPHLRQYNDDEGMDGASSSHRNSDLPYFGGLTVVLACDYLQLLPVLPSRRVVQLEDGTNSVVPVCLLDEIP